MCVGIHYNVYIGAWHSEFTTNLCGVMESDTSNKVRPEVRESSKAGFQV